MQRLTDLIGHGDQVRALDADLIHARCASTYLLVGRNGVGKRTLARAFAAAKLCAQPQAEGACGRCPSCRCLDAGTHPDFEIVEAGASGRGRIEISDVRAKVIANLYLAPRMGACRALLLDGADRLSTAAQHALLKTLEEPPPGSLLLLVARTETGLLETVLSRCRVLRFGRLAGTECQRVLELAGHAGAEIAPAVQLADGSPGEAVQWLQNPFFAERERIGEWIFEGAPSTPELRDLLPGLDATSGAEGTLAERRERLRSLLSMVIAIAGVIVRSSVQVVPEGVMDYDLPAEDGGVLRSLCARWYKATVAALDDLERMVTPELVFEVWSARIPR